ncbi:hypothetical protein MLGJGCBP_06953 [Rhodococcus sp. T7]|nr:hypothetical protein MLGJGCBP_09584 [Rhodococcus sp. T7]KAF0959918.1 hypothetical protein MLGJGCBP_06953 [Rhodococcus sp. T7]
MDRDPLVASGRITYQLIPSTQRERWTPHWGTTHRIDRTPLDNWPIELAFPAMIWLARPWAHAFRATRIGRTTFSKTI